MLSALALWALFGFLACEAASGEENRAPTFDGVVRLTVLGAVKTFCERIRL